MRKRAAAAKHTGTKKNRPGYQPDGSFKFILKSPPASILLKKAAGVDKGSSVPNRDKVGTVTRDQVREIAEIKMKDLNANDIEGAMRQIEGTARNMGIEVTD